MNARRPAGAGATARVAHELLRRVVAAGLAERFALMEVCPADATSYLAPLDRLLDVGCVERVVEAPGKWWYRLTAAGREIGAAEKPPKRWLRLKTWD